MTQWRPPSTATIIGLVGIVALVAVAAILATQHATPRERNELGSASGPIAQEEVGTGGAAPGASATTNGKAANNGGTGPMPPQREDCATLDGVFVVVHNRWTHLNLTQADWDWETGRMSDLGMTTIIIQNTVTYHADGKIRAAYPSAFISLHEPTTDQIERLLTAADARGMRVFLGLIDNPAAFQQNGNDIWHWTWPWYWQHEHVSQELYDLYKSHPSFVGFYVTQEPTVNYMRNPDTNAAVQYYVALTAMLKTKHPDKLVSGAPTYVAQNGECRRWDNIDQLAITPAEMESLLDDFLSRTSFDEIFLQDKMGTGLVAPERLGDYLTAAKRAADRNGVTYATDAELFRYCNNCAQFCPAQPTETRQQLETARTLGDTVTYEWFSDLSPRSGATQAALYDALLHETATCDLFPNYRPTDSAIAR